MVDWVADKRESGSAFHMAQGICLKNKHLACVPK